jgi:SAM-dependent methyltransferase
MAHAQQLEFVELLAKQMPRFSREAKVLEIGSLDINGSIRQFFDRCVYTGIDIAEGKGVDLVCQGQEYGAPDGSFDHVISCEAMEHNPFWKETFANMIRLCRAGGLVSMTCATTGRDEHGTTNSNPVYSPLTIAIGWEYYRNLTAHDFMKSFDFRQLFARYRFWVDWSSFDLYFAGIKSGSESTNADATEWTAFIDAVEETVMKHNSSLRSLLLKIAARTVGDTGFAIGRKIKHRRI